MVGFRPGRQHQDWGLAFTAHGRGKAEARLPRHHDIEHQQIESQPPHMRPGAGRVLGGRNPESILAQELGEKIADALVVIDHQDMEGVVGKLCGRHGSGLLFDHHCRPRTRF